MIIFNELYINNDSKLIIDASVLDVTIDPNRTIGIDHIYVGYGTNKTSNCTDWYEQIDNPAIFDRVDKVGDAVRGFRLVLDLNIGSNYNKLVYVNVTVDTDIDVPCTLRTSIESYAYDRCMVLQKVLDYVKASDALCENIQDYANYIVQVDGLELAVESGNFSLANLYWNKFFANGACCGSSITHKTGCGCRH